MISHNPFVFVVGCPRSGTTLLKRILDAHPDLAITPETHWIPRCSRRSIGVSQDGRITADLYDYLRSYRKFANLRLDPVDVDRLFAHSPPLGYADFVSRIFDLYGQRSGKKLVGDKTPGYARHIGLLHELWPQAKFVHLIRDGRDVCLSVQDWKRTARNVGQYRIWSQDRVSTIALWWEQLVLQARCDGAELRGSLYYELHYEDLLAEPEATCRDLCTFLGIDYAPSMLGFHQGKTKRDPGLRAKQAWLPITPGLRDWHKQLDRQDVERFEAIAGHLLRDLGYERGCKDVSSRARQEGARARKQFESDPVTQRRRSA